MGCDFLDFEFRLEKRLKMKLAKNDLLPALAACSLPRKPFDFMVCELQRAVLRIVEAKRAAGSILWTTDDIQCTGCRAILRQTPVPGFCRYCGASVSAVEVVNHHVIRCLVDVLGVDLKEVVPEAYLFKDLGMS